MKKNDFEQLRVFLPDSIKAMGLEQLLNENRILMAWRELFGNSTEKYIGRIYIKNSVLYVEITSSLLKQNLLYQKNTLIEKLNQRVRHNVLCDIIFL